MDFIFCGTTINDLDLENEKWLKLLYYTRENLINLERVSSIEQLSKENLVLKYTEKTEVDPSQLSR